jgi:hypothetical protein
MKTSKTPADTSPRDLSRRRLARHTGLMMDRVVRQRIDQFMQLVLASSVPAYQIFIDSRLRPITRRAKPVFLDQQCTISLADYIDGFRAYADQTHEGMRSPHLTYAPHIELFFEMFPLHPVAGSRGHPNSHVPGGGILADVYNDFVDLLRRVAANRKLDRVMHNWAANGHCTCEKLDRYLAGLFTRPGSLTVMHLNVVHSTQPFNLEFTVWAEQEKFLRDLATVRQIFLNRRANHPALFEHMKGYVWSIETSLPEGFSLHLTLLFDTTGLVHTGNLNGGLDAPLALSHVPASQRSRITFPQLVGEYIVRVATKGKGRYRICHQDPSHYPDWPYGIIEANDLQRRNQLAEVLSHLSMKHDFARLKNLPKGGRGKPRNPPFFGIGRLEARRSNERARQARSMRNGVSLGQKQ